MSRLGIVIPCLNEQSQLESRLQDLKQKLAFPKTTRICVVDAFFNPGSKAIANGLGCTYISTEFARRSLQLNAGAQALLDAEILFFLHADTAVPRGFDQAIEAAVAAGYESGCFRLEFDSERLFLKLFAWFTRFKWLIARGGDQGLFTTREAFDEAGRYREDLEFMEDTALCQRLMKRGTFVVRPESVVTSARKYERVGVVKLQAIFGLMHLAYHMGLGARTVSAIYVRLVR